MRRPLFDVVISVSGDEESGTLTYDVRIVDTRDDSSRLIGRATSPMTSLDEAMRFAKGAVSAFIEGTGG